MHSASANNTALNNAAEPQSLHISGGPNAILRLEGLLAAGVGIAVFSYSGMSWWLFAALILLPDISMLGYLAGRKWGAAFYNLGHSYLSVGALYAGLLAANSDLATPLASIWLTHIGIDRALGYGLKYSRGFAFTHLGQAKVPGAANAR